jgi:glycosyltransferase involved in cell wall biosynthesis
LIPALEGISCRLVIIGKIGTDITELLEKHQVVFENINVAISEAEIIRHYQESDIVSFVSLLEGFGMPIVEANTVGRVVITGNNSSMPEIAGNAAHIVDSYDIAAIREGIMKLIKDDVYREQLIQNGYENCKRFHKETIADQHYELYREVAALNG